ncbi:fibronectin type III domain-containing protein [Jatrophihabitans fulvus]
MLALLLVAGAVAVVSLVVKPDEARSFDLFGGSVFLADQVAPVAVDLATGRPTVRLVDAAQQVGASRADRVGVVPTSDGTLLLNRVTGEFNMVDATGFVIKTDGGVPLPRRAGATGAVALAARNFAYIAQTGPTGTSTYVVNAATVQRASSTAAVKPRAFRSMPQPVSTGAGAAATAGDDLWLLAGTGTDRSLRRLSVRPDSVPGSTLAMQQVGDVSGPAALVSADDGSRTLGPTYDGTPTSARVAGTVGIADRERVRVYRGDQVLLDRAVTAPAGLDTILPAHDSATRLNWLMHGTDGWSLVSVGADGTDLRGPTPLRGLARDAVLVPPAVSNGRLYTVDTGDGGLLQIDAAGRVQRLDGMGSYPVASQGGRRIEASGFADSTVVARGPRVIVNSPNHLLAVGIFTDGSRGPVRIQKSSAINVNAGGGAEALARSRRGDDPSQRPPKQGPPKAVATPAQPVNTSVDCTATSQKPHIPAFGQPVPGSRSVQLSWTYPVTDRGDCIPSTYVVEVSTLSGDAPSAPASVTVQGQQGVNLTGLYPSTRYELRVTAYLNGKGTASAPIQVTTGPEGPGAATAVTARADATGTWTVDWRSCGAQSDDCVPASTWRVIPQYCDGRGLSAAPATLEVPADPTTRTQPGAALRGGSALLGRSLSFQVVGVGADGSVGAPSATSACVASWAPPNTAALRLSASSPADVDAGGTTTTTLSLSLGDDPLAAVGGVGATVTFVLTGPGGAQTSTTTVDGRSGVLTHTFDGVRPGVRYAATARVSPPGHPEAAVTVDAGQISTRSRWPGLGVTASCPSTGLLTCQLSVTIAGISSAAVGGERFDLTSSSALQCGQVTVPLEAAGFDPSSGPVVTRTIGQLPLGLFGSCTVTAALVESDGAAPPLYFGGVPSPAVSTAVNLGAAATAGLTPADFNVTWTDAGPASVSYNGQYQEAVSTMTAQVLAPDGTECSTAEPLKQGTAQPLKQQVDVSAGDCVQQYGATTSGWQVRIVYTDAVDGTEHRLRVDLVGGPRTYVPPPPPKVCTVGSVTAAWGATQAEGVNIAVSGTLTDCTDWTYTLTAPDDTAPCADTDGQPPATIQYAGKCTTTPSQSGWTVVVTWTDADGQTTGSGPIMLDGSPPDA